MQMAHHEWPRLLKKFWKGQLTEEEHLLFRQYRESSTAKEEQYKRSTNRHWVIRMLRGMYLFDKEASWKKVEAKAGIMPEAIPLRRSYKRLYRAAASIAGICLLSVALYFIASKKDEWAAVLPNKAELIWLNDMRVVIAKAKQGLLAQTGAAIAYKEKDTLCLGSPVQLTINSAQIAEVVLPRGSHCVLRLPDSTRVWMNAGSRIRFPVSFSASERWVEMDGSGYLDVAHNPAAPFVVRLKGGYRAVAYGTRFIVHSSKTDSLPSITLLEGAVRMYKESAPYQYSELLPNEPFTPMKKNKQVTKDLTAVEDAAAWTSNLFNLNKDLRSVLADIAQWYDVQVVYDKRVGNPLLHGVMDREQALPKTLQILSESLGLHIKVKKNVITVSP